MTSDNRAVPPRPPARDLLSRGFGVRSPGGPQRRRRPAHRPGTADGRVHYRPIRGDADFESHAGRGRGAAARPDPGDPRRSVDAWLRVPEAEETTLDGYHGYVRRCIKPALGDLPISKITAQLLEEFYAELR